MARYRIKKDPSISASADNNEYWRQVNPRHRRDLDMEEIAELNKLADNDEDEYTQERTGGIRFVLPLIAVVVLICFTYLFYGNYINNWDVNDFSFLKQSLELSENQSLNQLKNSVVSNKHDNTQGTGFNISENGIIVTNKHVVSGANKLTVTFDDGKAYIVNDWQELNDVDIALINLHDKKLPYLQLADNYPQIGDSVVFIGNPLGFDYTISQGEVKEIWFQQQPYPVIYISGPVMPGSSGSPVFNDRGLVIGIVYASIEGIDNSGLVIPVDAVNDYLDEKE